MEREGEEEGEGEGEGGGGRERVQTEIRRFVSMKRCACQREKVSGNHSNSSV